MGRGKWHVSRHRHLFSELTGPILSSEAFNIHVCCVCGSCIISDKYYYVCGDVCGGEIITLVLDVL